MAQKTGQISSEITFSKKLALIFSVSTSPTQPKSNKQTASDQRIVNENRRKSIKNKLIFKFLHK
jgi:hypothetical protein